MIVRVLAGFIVALILLSGNTGWCDSKTNKEEKVYAVQNRIFHRSHEIDLSVGYTSDDDFFNVYPISLGYTFNFGEQFSWEVLRFGYNYNQDKDLKKTLEDEFNVTPERFPEPIYMFHSHLVYKPLYGKHAVLNRGIVNSEIYALAGLGTVHYEWEKSFGESESEDAISVSVGVGMKFFISERICVNAEVRHLTNMRKDDTDNNYYFGVGAGYRFNLAPRKVVSDPTHDRLKKILEEK